MKSTLKKIFLALDQTETAKFIIYPILVASLAGMVLQHIMFICLIPIEGSARATRQQIFDLCGPNGPDVWWGGINMVNYFLKPTFECDGYTTTGLGFLILISFSILIIQIIRNNVLEIKFSHSIKKTIFYLIGGISCVIIYRLIIAGITMGGEKAYWGPYTSFFIDFILYLALIFMVLFRTINKMGTDGDANIN